MQIFEDYKRIAQHNGFKYSDKFSGKNLITPSDRILNSKVCCMHDEGIVFFASDSYAAKAYVSSTFSGVYTTMPFRIDKIEATISKHFWYDFLVGKKRVLTGDSYIDRNLRITTNDVENTVRFLKPQVVERYLNLWEKYSPVKIVIGTNYLPEIEEFKNKVVVGLELMEWIVPENFNETYKDFKEFINSLRSKVN